MIAASLLSRLGAAVAGHGLVVRSGFRLETGDEVPAGPDGRPARALVLIGNAGGAMWAEFSAWLDRQPDVMADPLDTWTKDVIDPVAAEFGARAVYPNDRPYLPFQRWAMRAEGLEPSPLGVLMHPDYGLWHAYRAALLFAADVPIQAPEKLSHPCKSCVERPCLTACPVSAYSISGFDVRRCAGHAGSAAGHVCREAGCRSRNACPVGADYRYNPAQQGFHMAAFLGAHPGD